MEKQSDAHLPTRNNPLCMMSRQLGVTPEVWDQGVEEHLYVPTFVGIESFANDPVQASEKEGLSFWCL
jgi:hypothetical protein